MFSSRNKELYRMHWLFDRLWFVSIKTNGWKVPSQANRVTIEDQSTVCLVLKKLGIELRGPFVAFSVLFSSGICVLIGLFRFLVKQSEIPNRVLLDSIENQFEVNT